LAGARNDFYHFIGNRYINKQSTQLTRCHLMQHISAFKMS